MYKCQIVLVAGTSEIKGLLNLRYRWPSLLLAVEPELDGDEGDHAYPDTHCQLPRGAVQPAHLAAS